MNGIRYKIFFFFFCLAFLSRSTAQDSSHLRISLLTCAPGEELYSIFGHSAIRITDSSAATDYVYNYGTFNFDDNGFYLKFARGKLLYYISVADFRDFREEYIQTNRGITEQLLDLSAEEKVNIQQLLTDNLKSENKFYKYDFFLDNCTTRLRDIIVASKYPHPALPAVMPANTTFRNAIHQYLDKGKQYWSKLAIDILLGKPTDAIMTAGQQQFLPDNLMNALNGSVNIRIVKSSANLYNLEAPDANFSWFTPMLFFTLMLFIFITISYSKKKSAKNLLTGMDGVLFFVTGLLGIIIIFMMNYTDHSMTKNNYNILWAWPTHLIASFFVSRPGKAASFYFLATALAQGLLLLSWFFLPQQMNNALLPFVLLLLYRSAVKFVKYNDNTGTKY